MTSISVCSSHKPIIWLQKTNFSTWHFFVILELNSPNPSFTFMQQDYSSKTDFQPSVFVFWDNSTSHGRIFFTVALGRQVLVSQERNMDVKREGTGKRLSWKTSQVTNTLRVITHKQIIKSSELLWPLRQRVCVSALMNPASRVTLPWYKQTWIWHPACQKLDFARWWLRVDAQRETHIAPLGAAMTFSNRTHTAAASLQ